MIFIICRFTLFSFRKLSMKTSNLKYTHLCWLLAIPFLMSCNALLNKQPVQTNYYALTLMQSNLVPNANNNQKTMLPTLTVNTPKAVAGFDSNQMLYTRNTHQVEHFSRNEWVDTPANMLQSLLILSLENTGDFKAVLPKSGAIKSEIKLDSQVVTLLQNFDTKPSKVDFGLRVSLINSETNQVIASQLFMEQVMAKSDTPAGGVGAANEAVNLALKKVGLFIKQALKN